MSIKEKMLKTIEMVACYQTKEKIQEFLHDLEAKKKIYSPESSNAEKKSEGVYRSNIANA